MDSTIFHKLILDLMVKHYLSTDNTGFPVFRLRKHFKDIIGQNFNESEFNDVLINMIKTDEIELISSLEQVNPHVKLQPAGPINEQIERLASSSADPNHICLYPSKKILVEHVDVSKYSDQPFTLEMALGEPQLSARHFDIDVLERYRNNPQYSFCKYIAGGKIFSTDENCSDGERSSRRKFTDIYLKSYGYSYNSEDNAAIAVYLVYLSDLPSEEQKRWYGYLVKGDYKLDETYRSVTQSVIPSNAVSVFDAIIEEMSLINTICRLNDSPKLFKEEYNSSFSTRSGKKTLTKFDYIFRPTYEEYFNFILLAFKMIVENINPNFFSCDDLTPYRKIMQLKKWLVNKKIENEIINNIVDYLNYLRAERNELAHEIDQNYIDRKFRKKQLDIVVDLYDCLLKIRKCFMRIFDSNEQEMNILYEPEDVCTWNPY